MGFFGNITSGGAAATNRNLLIGNTGQPLYVFDPSKNVFSDTAGTVPAVINTDDVAYTSDDNNIINFNQTTSANRPSLELKRNKEAIYFDGVSERLESSTIVQQFFQTFGNHTDSDKPFTIAMIFEPESTATEQTWLEVSSSTNSNSYYKFSLSSTNNYIQQDHDTDSNNTNLLYTSSIAPIFDEPNLWIIQFDGELGTHYLHNSARDLEVVLTAPLGHNDVMHSLDRSFLGSSVSTTYAKGWLYYMCILEGVFVGLPELVKIFAEDF